MAVDLAREMHLASVRRRLDREMTGAGAWAWEGHWPIAVEYYQGRLAEAERKYDARLAEAEQRRANQRAWRREMPSWTPDLIAAIKKGIDEDEAAAAAAAPE
jgi:hypothetical protein